MKPFHSCQYGARTASMPLALTSSLARTLPLTSPARTWLASSRPVASPATIVPWMTLIMNPRSRPQTSGPDNPRLIGVDGRRCVIVDDLDRLGQRGPDQRAPADHIA